MSYDKTLYPKAAELLAKIQNTNASDDPLALVAMYEELIPLMRMPRAGSKDLSPLEKLERRQRRKELKAQGLNVRTGKPYTQEELAAIDARNTPEKVAERKAKATARMSNPETKAKIAEAAKQRAAKQEWMIKRLAELEAMAAAQNNGQVTNPDSEQVSTTPAFGGGKRARSRTE